MSIQTDELPVLTNAGEELQVKSDLFHLIRSIKRVVFLLLCGTFFVIIGAYTAGTEQALETNTLSGFALSVLGVGALFFLTALVEFIRAVRNT